MTSRMMKTTIPPVEIRSAIRAGSVELQRRHRKAGMLSGNPPGSATTNGWLRKEAFSGATITGVGLEFCQE